MKFGNLNFLEPSGPLHVCNGSALYIHTYIYTETDGETVAVACELCMHCNNRRFSRQMSNLFLTLNNVRMSLVTDGIALVISRSSEKECRLITVIQTLYLLHRPTKTKTTANFALFLKPGDLLSCSQEVCYWVSHSAGKLFNTYFLNHIDIQLLIH